jgi:hypothetical protein
MNATKPARDPQYLYSRATLPDGRLVIIKWDRGDAIDVRLESPDASRAKFSGDGESGEAVDLFSVFGSREAAETWIDERTEDEGIDP